MSEGQDDGGHVLVAGDLNAVRIRPRRLCGHAWNLKCRDRLFKQLQL